tara:strand:- start:59 stop:769 length:711 start_codon:yes stop_codon:yes gene_type:complete
MKDIQIFNIFPTTIYTNTISNHEKYKEEFYKIYSKYDYEQKSFRDGGEWYNTTSENTGNPLIHLEDNLSDLFNQIIDNVKIYTLNVLKYQDIFDYIITKTWISRSRATYENIKWHSHSTSHISFSYYINTPQNSHALKFANPHYTNSLFMGLNSSDVKDGVAERNELNASTFHLEPKEGSLILFPSSLKHCTECTSDNFEGERLAIVGDITLVYKEDGTNDYSMGYINPKYWKMFR